MQYDPTGTNSKKTRQSELEKGRVGQSNGAPAWQPQQNCRERSDGVFADDWRGCRDEPARATRKRPWQVLADRREPASQGSGCEHPTSGAGWTRCAVVANVESRA